MDPASRMLSQREGQSRVAQGAPASRLSILFLISAVALLIGLCGARAQINPGIVDPTNTYAGKTYNQLAAGWWQYFMSLPTTNSPLIATNPLVPMSTGQSGPVWFVGGSYVSAGANSYTNTIPSVGLFLIISAIEKDNAACPGPNHFNEPFLRTAAGDAENLVTNMSCTIDGVPISAIDDRRTTPYRVQSPAFSYNCPALHNYLRDYRNGGLPCYENNSGIPYTIDGAIIDGVFLMISPLSIGSHVITATAQFSFGYSATTIHYLTVQAPPLSLGLNQNSQVVLSWPQTPDTYAVESSSILEPPDWQPFTNLTINLSDGIYHATAPIAVTNQFFRLRLE